MSTNALRTSMTVSDENFHVLCDPCRFNGKTTVAMKYCRECNGHLCHNCINTHMKITNTRNHHVSYILTKRAQNNVSNGSTGGHVTQSMQKSLEMKCIDHGKHVVSFCLVHDALCCRVCIGTNHRECKLQVLSEAASGSKESRELRSVEANIKRLQAKFEEANKEKQTNLQHLDHQNDTFTNAVKSYRRTINNILDKLEQNLLKAKDRHFETKVEELRGCLKTCQAAIGALNGALNKLDIAARQGDEQHTFLTVKKVQAISKRYEKLYSTDVEKLPKNVSFHFQPDLNIEKFLKGVAELGKIKEESSSVSPSHGVAKVKDQKKIQPEPEIITKRSSADSGGRQKSPRKPALSPRQSLTPEELNVRIPTDKKTCSVTGTAFLPDERIVIADATNQKIKVFGHDLRLLGSLEMLSAPRDVTMVSNTEIACTMPNEKTVQLLHVINRDVYVKKTIKLDVECYGIVYHNNEFFITSGWSTEKEVQVFDSEGVVLRKLRPKAGILKCPLYVTVDTKCEHVYVSDYEKGIVGMDMGGKVIFRYNDDFIKGFMGICSTPSGDVFVCTLQPNGISRVQTENKLMGSLPSLNLNELEPLMSLPNKGGQRPRSIAVSKRTNKLVISFVGQSVDVMSIYHM